MTDSYLSPNNGLPLAPRRPDDLEHLRRVGALHRLQPGGTLLVRGFPRCTCRRGNTTGCGSGGLSVRPWRIVRCEVGAWG